MRSSAVGLIFRSFYSFVTSKITDIFIAQNQSFIVPNLWKDFASRSDFAKNNLRKSNVTLNVYIQKSADRPGDHNKNLLQNIRFWCTFIMEKQPPISKHLGLNGINDGFSYRKSLLVEKFYKEIKNEIYYL